MYDNKCKSIKENFQLKTRKRIACECMHASVEFFKPQRRKNGTASMANFEYSIVVPAIQYNSIQFIFI